MAFFRGYWKRYTRRRFGHKTTTRRPKRVTGFRKRRKIYKVMPITSPIKHLVRLRYAIPTPFNLTSTGGAITEYVFNITSLRDPGQAATSTAVRGFDQWMSLYGRYLVIGVKARLTFSYSSTGATSCHVMTAHNAKDSDLGTVTNYHEERFNRCSIINPSSKFVTIVHKISPAKYRSKSDPLDDPNLSGTATVDPVSNVYLHIGCKTVDASSTQTVVMSGWIDFIAVLTSPVQPPISYDS